MSVQESPPTPAARSRTVIACMTAPFCGGIVVEAKAEPVPPRPSPARVRASAGPWGVVLSAGRPSPVGKSLLPGAAPLRRRGVALTATADGTRLLRLARQAVSGHDRDEWSRASP